MTCKLWDHIQALSHFLSSSRPHRPKTCINPVNTCCHHFHQSNVRMHWSIYLTTWVYLVSRVSSNLLTKHSEMLTCLVIICLVIIITLPFTSTGYRPQPSSIDICSTTSIAYSSYLRPLSLHQLIPDQPSSGPGHSTPTTALTSHVWPPTGFHSLISWQILLAVAQQPPKDCSQPVVEQDPSSLSSVTKPHPWPSSWLVCWLTEAFC